MYHNIDLARSLIVDAQGRAATPCSGIDPDLNTDREMGILGDLTQPQPLNVSDIFDWGKAGTMALDELPESGLWYRSDYKLTQEWLDKTLEQLKETDEEKRVATEREADKRAEIGADMDEDGLSHGGNEASYDS